ncbi:MAG: endonuclease/exonuclease/phosphatase family protein [Planctomycetota bacterium]|nr:endonuclease/exonuclease/phosphatase family protein [Planctomycetota bacterium]
MNEVIRPQSFVSRVMAGALLLTAALLGGCTSSRGVAASPASITFDGDVSEWRPEVVAAADQDWIAFRWSVKGEQFTPQANKETLAVWIDADENAATGFASDRPALAGLGIDLVIEFSRVNPSGLPLPGVAVYRCTGDARELVNLRDADVLLTPTYAAEWYEGRVSRHMLGLPSGSSAAGAFVLQGEAGKVVGQSEVFRMTLPSLAASKPMLEGDLPIKPAGAIRVLSYNVQKSGPLKNPVVFARVLRAIDADVLMLQEWGEGDATQLQEWFFAHVRQDREWSVHKPAGAEVAVVSRFPVRDGGLAPVLVNVEGRDKPWTVRATAAIVDTPAGDIAFATTHLKCCGSMNSGEDELRIAETKALQASLASLWASGPAMRVVGGDINLVGTKTPRDNLFAGLDSGAPLTAAPAFVLGDRAMSTWADPPTFFGPGRLDWVGVSASSLRTVNAFVLDTSRLGERSLARLGMDASDTDASDHKPVVVDVLPR